MYFFYVRFVRLTCRPVFCVNRRDRKRDASALLTDLTQQNTGKSSPLVYPASPADPEDLCCNVSTWVYRERL